jgi:uncharacterized protein (TIGR00730 family)
MNRICVYCGSSSGSNQKYEQAALATAEALLARNYGLVYGGARVGLMGTIADRVLAGGGEVYGVIPKSMVDREIAHTGLTELHVVETMHQRKARMVDLAGGFLALPGAYGTLDEWFETLTWAQLGIHAKPCGLLNLDGYYDGLLAFLDRCVGEGFLKQTNRDLFLVGGEPGELLDRMREWKPLSEPKWFSRDVR